MVKTNSSFVAEGQEVRDNIDFIFGYKTDGFIFSFGRSWDVAILFKDDVVTEILVNMDDVSL